MEITVSLKKTDLSNLSAGYGIDSWARNYNNLGFSPLDMKTLSIMRHCIGNVQELLKTSPHLYQRAKDSFHTFRGERDEFSPIFELTLFNFVGICSSGFQYAVFNQDRLVGYTDTVGQIEANWDMNRLEFAYANCVQVGNIDESAWG